MDVQTNGSGSIVYSIAAASTQSVWFTRDWVKQNIHLAGLGAKEFLEVTMRVTRSGWHRGRRVRGLE